MYCIVQRQIFLFNMETGFIGSPSHKFLEIFLGILDTQFKQLNTIKINEIKKDLFRNRKLKV